MVVVHFLDAKWEPCHVVIEFFEVVHTFGSALVLQVNDLLAKHGLKVCVIAYIKRGRQYFHHDFYFNFC